MVAVVVGHVSIDVLELDVGIIFREEGVKLGSKIREGWPIVGVLHPAFLHQLVAVEIQKQDDDFTIVSCFSLSVSLSVCMSVSLSLSLSQAYMS